MRPRPMPGRGAHRPEPPIAAVCPTEQRAARPGSFTGTPAPVAALAASLHDEIGPPVRRIRTGGAEAADRRDDERRVVGEHVVGAEPERLRGRPTPFDWTTTSATPRRSSRSAAPPGPSTTTLRLFVLRCANAGALARSGSPPGDSTFTTSAPRSANTFPQYVPAGSVRELDDHDVAQLLTHVSTSSNRSCAGVWTALVSWTGDRWLRGRNTHCSTPCPLPTATALGGVEDDAPDWAARRRWRLVEFGGASNVNRADLIALAKRMLDLIDRKTTDLAPSVMLEPMAMYTSPDVLRQERELIFGRSPMFLGMSGDLPGPGTWKSVDIVDTPYLLCRDADGEVQLFLNSCRHRGVKVVDGAGSSANLRCPFHAWTYDLAGTLIAITEPEGFEGLCKEEHGLISLPVVERYGMIFGAPVPGPPLDADDFLCGLGPELAEWGFERFSLYTERHPHPFRGNWKFAWDTYCENYHFAFLHEKTLEGYLVNRRQAVDFFGPHVRMVSALQIDPRAARPTGGGVGSGPPPEHPVPDLPVGELHRLPRQERGPLGVPG